MRYLLVFLCFNLLHVCYSQEFGKKDFYLIDSLDLTHLKSSNLTLIDSCLSEYHKAEADTSRINALAYITVHCTNNNVCERYNRFGLVLIQDLLNSPDNTFEETQFFDKYLGYVYGDLGYFEKLKGNIPKALDFYFQALTIYERLGNTSDAAILYNNIALVYIDIGNDKKAVEFLLKAKELLEKESKDKAFMIPHILNNIAILVEKETPERALLTYIEALELFESLNDNKGVAIANSHMGRVYVKLDSLDLGLQYLTRAESFFLELENDWWIATVKRELAKYFLKIKDLQSAQSYGELSYYHAEKSQRARVLLNSSKVLYQIYDEQKDFEKALYHYVQYTKLNDSISGEEVKMMVMRKEISFENEKEKLIAENENEKRLEYVKMEGERQKVLIYAILFGLLLTILFAIVIYSRLQVARQQKKIIEKQNNERKLLLQEIHHRVKNNFQIITSTLNLQAADEDDPVVAVAFTDAINRIHSIASVHEMIYKQDDFGEVEPKQYFKRLSERVSSYSRKQVVSFDIDSNVQTLDIKTLIPLGMSVNELITNSVKHAFTGMGDEARVRIRLEKINHNDYFLSYQDNGKGIRDSSVNDSFGMELIKSIIDQIDGRLEQVKDDSWSTSLRILFSLN